MFRRTVLVLVVVAFVFGLSVAFAAPVPEKIQNQPKAVLDNDRIQKMVDDLTARLNLTNPQQVKVKGILVQTESEIQKIMADLKIKVQDLLKQQKGKIDAVLTVEQKAKLEGMRASQKPMPASNKP